jgi:hypothetical protein
MQVVSFYIVVVVVVVAVVVDTLPKTIISGSEY